MDTGHLGDSPLDHFFLTRLSTCGSMWDVPVQSSPWSRWVTTVLLDTLLFDVLRRGWAWRERVSRESDPDRDSEDRQ